MENTRKVSVFLSSSRCLLSATYSTTVSLYGNKLANRCGRCSAALVTTDDALSFTDAVEVSCLKERDARLK